MSRTGRVQKLFRIRGTLKLFAGAVILALVLVRARILLSFKPAVLASGSVSETTFTLVAQIGLLVVLALIGLMILARGIQLLGMARRQIEA